MRPYWSSHNGETTVTLYQADVLDALRELPAESVQCVVTSPPYYGLRNYGVEGQIGLEATPEEYVTKLVEVFREVRRVLRPDGVLWLNLGDSYNGSGGAGGDYGPGGLKEGQPRYPGRRISGLKPKDLIGIPWRVAFALQEDGWWLRCDIIWAKTRTTPESVTDRPTRAHEYVFLMAKSERYFYDADAIKEPLASTPEKYLRAGKSARENRRFDIAAGRPIGSKSFASLPNGRNKRSVWWIATEPFPEAHFATFPEELPRLCILAGTSPMACPKCGAPWERVVERHGSTWEDRRAAGAVEWRPTCSCGAPPDVEPEDLEFIESPTGSRVEEDPTPTTGRKGFNRPRGPNEGVRLMTRYEQRQYAKQLRNSPYRERMEAEAGSAFAHYIRTDRAGARPVPPELLDRWLERGWIQRVVMPALDPPAPVPATVLDPFCGSGTTLLMAQRLGRNSIGIELNPEYCEIAKRRISAEHSQLRLAIGVKA